VDAHQLDIVDHSNLDPNQLVTKERWAGYLHFPVNEFFLIVLAIQPGRVSAMRMILTLGKFCQTILRVFAKMQTEG
jgi:hypothetical protein